MRLEGEPGHVPRTAVLGSCGHHARHQPTSLEEFLRSFLMAVPMLFIVYLDFLFLIFWSYFSVSVREEISGRPQQASPPTRLPIVHFQDNRANRCPEVTSTLP